jgi:hypothetical protein
MSELKTHYIPVSCFARKLARRLLFIPAEQQAATNNKIFGEGEMR